MQDLEHKMTVVSDEPDLQEDYKITQEQAEGFRKQISRANALKIREVSIPHHMIPVILGEMENMADIYASNYSGEGSKVFLQAYSIQKQLEKLT